MEEIERVRDFFKKDRYATESGMVIDEIGEKYAKCSMDLNEHHTNAVGAVMGGVYFVLADFTFAVANNWKEPSTVSLNSNISYLKPAKGQRLIGEAVCIKDGRTTNLYRIDITDDEGNLCATVNITGFKTNHR